MTSYFSRLDLDSRYLVLAKNVMNEESLVKATVKVTIPKDLPLDENFLMQRFERMGEIKYENTLERDYLERIAGFSKDFVDYIYDVEYPSIEFADGDFTLFGSKGGIYLSYCALRNLITEHLTANFLDKELIMKDTVFAEGIRKLMMKFDMVRNSDFKFIESGTDKRFSYEWQVLVFNTLMGDLKANVAGTTSPILGLLYGVPLYLPSSEAIRPVIDFVQDGQDVDGNIYEMMHCYVHRGNRNNYLWSDLSSDVIDIRHKIELIV